MPDSLAKVVFPSVLAKNLRIPAGFRGTVRAGRCPYSYARDLSTRQGARGGCPGDAARCSRINRPLHAGLWTPKILVAVDNCCCGLGMKILGFKLERYWEWRGAVLEAAGRGGFGRAAWRMVVGLWSGKVGRREWRERMRFGCGVCPLNQGRVCMVVDGNRELGCGCYVPFKAMVRAPYAGGCWAREYRPESGFGWGPGGVSGRGEKGLK